MISIAERLKDLAKDESSYSELLEILHDLNPLTNDENAVNSFFSDSDYLYWAVSRDINRNDLFFSDSIKKISGYSADELKMRRGHLMSIIHESDLSEVKSRLTDFEETPDIFSVNLSYRIVNRRGETVWLEGTVIVSRDNRGNVIKYFNLFKNISNLHLIIEKLIEENNELREKNSSKDRFISIVSHDLRAPFTSLLGFSEILLNEPDIPKEEKDEYLGYIHDSSESQLQLINYLLDWSRLQTGKLTIEKKRLNAKAMITNCVAQLTGAAMKKNIEIIIDCDSNLFINADDRLIMQTINNLLSNALKFTFTNRSIYIICNKFKKGFIEFIVRDEGTGISEENQAKIFRIDEKVSIAGTAGEKGSGLGLTLVKEIVNKHGGEIWFYSETGKGSEFHFTVPESNNMILLVEDNQDICELYADLISDVLPDYEIIRAQNGYEAICIVLKDTPSLVITDHEMPLMNGIQLVEAMMKNEENKDIPVIIISAKITPEVKNNYRDLGVRDILPKPVDTEQLLSIVKSAVKIN